MGAEDPQALCERLFRSFLAPLVLGGAMRPGKAIGGKGALSMGDGRHPSELETLSLTQLARVRVARQLAPVDRFETAPNGSEWALAAVLHDLVQSTHPGYNAVFRRSGPARLLSVVQATLERIPPPRSVGDALSRHTWFSRMFDLARTDVEVKWWTGSETFLGEEPPARLVLWPELRRVQQTRTPRPLMDLPTSGGSVDFLRFSAIIEEFLAKTPLTDLCAIDRASPRFVWRHESLALCSTHAGRTMVLRAFARRPDTAVDAALGHATRQLFTAKVSRALGVALDVLRDRALMAASAHLLTAADTDALSPSNEENGTQRDAAFATSAGALAAQTWLAEADGTIAESQRKELLRVLQPRATSPAASELRALLAG